MARPSEGEGCTTSLAAVYQWYEELLGRPPKSNADAIGYGRIGLPCVQVYDEIARSEEAQNYAARKAEERHANMQAVHDACEEAGGTWVGDFYTGACSLTPDVTPAPKGPSIPGLQGLVDWLGTVFAARDEILRKLGEKVTEVKTNVGTATADLQRQISESMNRYLPQVSDALAKFSTNVGALVQGMIPTTLGLVGAALGGVETIAAAFLNNAASIDDIITAVVEQLTGSKVDIGAFLAGAIGAAFEGGLGAAVNAFTEGHPNIVQDSIDQAMNVPGLTPRVRDVLNASRDYAHSPAAIFALGVVASTAIGISGALAEPDIENARQYAASLTQSTTLDVPDVMDGYVRGFVNESTARTLTKLKGLRQELFPYLANIRARQPEIEQVYAARFRGVITEEEKQTRLSHLGFTPETVAMLDPVMQNIPNVSDVLRFLVRDVFIPEFVEAFGMDKEYPPDADVWAAKLGIPHEVMMLHWRAHWDLPSVSQGYEMFQRAKLVSPNDPTGEIALRRLLRAQGVEPFWRDPLIAIAYSPLTRVDLRRMDKLKTITDEQLLRGYLDIGYSPEQARLLFDFTKQFNSEEKKAALKDITDGLKSRVITAVMNGTLDEQEGTTLLKDVGYAQEEIAAFLTEARLFRQETISKRVADLIGKLFVEGHRTEEEARTALREHGYIVGEIDLIIREWTLEKELKAPTARALAEKDLSASNVITSFIEDGMSEDQARAYLLYLRYDEKETDVLIAGAAFKRRQAEEKETIDAIHVRVLSGRLSEGDASAELSAANIVAKRRDALLAKWELERHGKVEKIPLSSLKDIYARTLWDDAKMHSYLLSTGYSEDDISALLILWGSQAEERKAREAAAAAKKGTKA